MDIYLLGAGGHAKVIADIIARCGSRVVRTLGREECSRKVGEVTIPAEAPGTMVIAIGDNQRRRLVAENLSGEYAVFVDPSAVVSESVDIGAGTVVMQHATIQTDSRIGRHCIINTAASVDHECEIADYCHVSPGAILCGNVTLGEGAWVGAGATLIPGVRIGKGATVGAGATILADVPDGVTAVGVWRKPKP